MALDPREEDEWNGRLERLERRQRRILGVVVLLLLVALTETAGRFLPGPPWVSATHFVLRKGSAPPRGEFALWEDGSPAFRLNNARGEARALWAYRNDGTLSLRMSDEHFNTKVEMSVDPAGQPAITLFGSDGHTRARLWVDSTDRMRADGLQP